MTEYGLLFHILSFLFIMDLCIHLYVCSAYALQRVPTRVYQCPAPKVTMSQEEMDI